jgi:hypothetical protein
MSPARSRRTPNPRLRSRTQNDSAVGVGVGIVVVTALVIWLMRPGPAGTLGTGGLMSRQPRASWLVGTALAVAAFTTWWILRVSRRARGQRLALPIALSVVALAAVAGAVAWPGGLLRHDVAPPKPVTPITTPTNTPTTGPSSTASSTTGPKTTTTGTTGTTAPTSTSSTGTSTTTRP